MVAVLSASQPLLSVSTPTRTLLDFSLLTQLVHIPSGKPTRSEGAQKLSENSSKKITNLKIKIQVKLKLTILLQDAEHKILRNQTIWILYLDDACLKLACQALLEVVQSSSKNIELALMRSNSPLEIVPLERVTKLVEEIEAEKAAEAEKKKQQRAASKAARE